MKKGILKYLVIAIAVLFVLPAGAYFGGQHGVATEGMGGRTASPNSVTYINPNTIPPNNTIQVSPPPRTPDVTPITYTIAHDFVTTKGNLHDYTYLNITLPSTPWQAVILNYEGHSVGQVYDTRAWMSVNSVAVFRDICAEAGWYNVSANLTQYEPLFHGPVTIYFSPPADAIVGFYESNVTISFYPGAAPTGLPNEIIPVIPLHQLYMNPKSNQTSYTVNLTVPSDAIAAVAQVWITSSGFDEFWYTLEPSYRAVELFSGSSQIANILPFYKVRTGGIDLFAWRPVTSPFELNDRPYNVNVTAALGLLEHNTNLTISAVGMSPFGGYWIFRVNLLVWTSTDVTGASSTGYMFKAGSPTISTDIAMPGIGTASTQSYFFEQNSSAFSYSSRINTSTGPIFVSRSTTELSVMDQYSVNAVWENLSGYQLTNTVMRTVYAQAGHQGTVLQTKTSYFAIQLQSGFVFSVTQTTNGGFPMYGPFAQYLNNMSITYDITHTYLSVSASGIVRGESVLSNDLYTNGDLFAGVIELTSPVAGIISSITAVQGTTMKTYTSLIYGSQDGRLVLESVYQHTIEAVSNNPPGPLYFGTIVLDEIYTF